MSAGFCREVLGGDPVLTVRDGGPVDGSFIDVSWPKARALRAWLNEAIQVD